MNRQLVYFLQRVASSAASAAVYILADKLSEGLQPKRYPQSKQSTRYQAKNSYAKAQTKPQLQSNYQRPVYRSKSEQARDKLNARSHSHDNRQ